MQYLHKFIIGVILLSILIFPLVKTGDADTTVNVTGAYYGPNWDITNDGHTNYLDLSSLSSTYGESGSPGWIRDDINRNGHVDYLDLSYLSSHYGETWIVP